MNSTRLPTMSYSLVPVDYPVMGDLASSRLPQLASPRDGYQAMTAVPNRQLPLTMVGVRKAVQIAISSTERDIYAFGNALMQKLRVTPKNLLRYLTQVESLMGVGAISDPETMLRILSQGIVTEELIGAEYFELQTMCQKLILVNRLLDEVPERMRAALEDNLYKYCVSFVEECEQEKPLSLAKEYDTFIRQTKQAVDDELKRVESKENVKRPKNLRDYIHHHDGVNSFMLNWCKSYLNIAKLAKRWLRVDFLYPQKLHETIGWINRRRKALQEALKMIKTREMNMDGKRMRQEILTRKGQDRAAHTRNEKRNLESRQRNIEAAKKEADDKIARLMEMRNVHLAEKTKAEQPSLSEYHGRHVSMYEGSILQARRRLQHLETISKEIEAEQQRCELTAEELDKTTDSRHYDLVESQQQLTMLQQERAGIARELKELNDQLELIRKIKEIKTHTDTVRKIYKHGYNPNHYQNVRDTTDDLFRTVAPVIGKHWREVYQKLPFDPHRDWKMRDIDLDGIDIHNRRLDPDFPMLAYLMLQKWRRLSQYATVDSLLQVLRKMRLAKDVQLDALQPEEGELNDRESI